MLSLEEQSELGRRLQTGDREAWAALYSHYNVAVWNFTARLVGSDRDGVADVVQEVFLAAAGSARRFDPDMGTLWSWLTGIAHRQISLYWRKAERADRWKTLVENGDIDFARYLEGDESSTALEEHRELAGLVRRVLAEITTDYAVLLTSKYLDERSMEDLAQEFGSSVEATKSKLARARREFQSAFQKLVGSDQRAWLS